MKYFEGLKTTAEIKKRYKELALKFHPDRGGDVATMSEINTEYERVMKRGGESSTDAATFKDIINDIIGFNADIEIIGSWIWVFNAYPYREQLKALGFRWASKRKAWIWHSADSVSGRSKRGLDSIRAKYGSETVKSINKLAACV